MRWWRRRAEPTPAPTRAGVLEALAAQADVLSGGTAEVSWQAYESAWILTLEIAPPRSTGAWVSFCGDLAEEESTDLWGMTICLEHGGRFEIGVDDEDVAFAHGILEAVIAGRIEVKEARGRSETTLTMSDGTPVVSIGYVAWEGGLVLQPGWRKNSPVRRFDAYRAAEGQSPDASA